MEEKRLDAAESLELIGRMIRNTRQRLERHSGRPFLIWGYTTVGVSLLNYALNLTGADPNWSLSWFLIPVLGYTLMRLFPEKRPTDPRTEIDRIVHMLREAGAKEVHFRSSAPKFLYPCYFGTDIDSRENLIAANYSTQEIADMIGVDSLGFLNVEHLPKLADHSTCGFCNGCFTGNYPVDPPRDTAKLKFERSLTERQKTEEGNL